MTRLTGIARLRRGIRTRLGGRRPRAATVAASTAALALGAVLLLAPTTNGAFTASITNSNDNAASASYFTCTAALKADSADALFVLPLNEAANSSTATDIDSGLAPGTYRGAMTTTNVSPQGCPRDPGPAYQLNGTTSYVSSGLLQIAPASYSTEVWFKTTTRGGKLIGFGNAMPGNTSGSYDRHTYINTSGQLVFGVYTPTAGITTIASPAAVTDGAWHHVVATMSTSTGMTLWLDGRQVAANTATRASEATTGYWRIGYDNLDTWPGAGSRYFTGSMRFAAVYTTALTSTQILNHYNAGR